MSKGQLLFRPGTILLFVFIAVFGLFVYNWASGSIQATGDETMEDQKDALECSRLRIDFIDFSEDDNSTELIFQFSKDVEAAEVSFKGEKNSSVRLQNLGGNSIHTAEVNGTGYSNAFVLTDGCGKIFSYR